ncbi:MAG: Na+ dependent nucleoside transporter [Crocinitomicaceae bacterium]|nr:Na+ dependent nucleoside transporter [Crocinitomicaceae bacterium]
MAHHGAEFVFGSFLDGKVNPYIKNFATWILPSVIFFSALTSLLYYWGILQRVVIGMAWVMKRLMGLSGAESVSAAGNIFLGQTESPLLVKPYLSRMTKSEILCLMAGGMATIAGGVLASYIGFLGGEDPEQKVYFAKHLLTASLMSAPAAIVFAKILFPEKEKINPDLSVQKEKLGANALEAITNGTTDGLKLAVNVGAMLIVFISLVALANYILLKLGYYTGLNSLISSWGHYSHLSFEAILGYTLSPFAWVMGVPTNDCLIVGQLLGEKTILNEFVAYGNLGSLKHSISDKATLMCTYVLCGFANFASIGIQVGGIGGLAPEKKSVLAKFGIKALIAGTLACMSTAVIAGMLF